MPFTRTLVVPAKYLQSTCSGAAQVLVAPLLLQMLTRPVEEASQLAGYDLRFFWMSAWKHRHMVPGLLQTRSCTAALQKVERLLPGSAGRSAWWIALWRRQQETCA